MFLNRFKIEIKEEILGMIKEGYIPEDPPKDWHQQGQRTQEVPAMADVA